MKVRNKNDNVRYINHIETAIDQANQAIDSITYSAYPELNQRTIAKLKAAIHSLEDALEAPLFKP